MERPWSGQVICLQQDRKGDLWVGTWDGVYRFPESRLSSENYEHFLPGKGVTSVLIDHEGNYWFTTLGAGVFTTPSPDIKTYRINNGLPSNMVTTLGMDPNDQLMMGFTGNKYACLTDKGVEVASITSSGARDQINAFAWNENGEMMVGADVFFALIKEPQSILKQIGFKCLLVEDNDHIWAGGAGRLFYFVQNPFTVPEEKWKVLFKSGDPSISLVIMEISTFALLKDRSGRFWAGTTQGLFEIRDFRPYPHDCALPQLRTRIQDLAETPEGELLVATYGMGLVLLKSDTFQVWDLRHGLLGNMCKSVTVDEAGQIWVGTDRGLTKLTRDSLSGEYRIEQSFMHSDGLASDVVNDVLIYNDQVCVATPNGLTLLPRAQLTLPQAPPFIHLTRFEAGDSVIPPGVSPRIRYRDRNLSFTFRGIHFRSPKNLGYRYRMEGIEENWHYTQNNQINYLETPPGNYTFYVEAVLPGGIVSEQAEQVSFQVLAPLWRRGWLIVLEVLLFLLILAVAFWLTVKQIKKRERKKAEIERKIAESELKALQAQMNPHFIFNSLNSIQRFILKNDPDAAYHHLERFGALMRMILENSKKKFITLEDELETLRLYLELESLRFEGQFTFRIDIGEDLHKHDLLLPPMLLQPYVENAILHGLTPKESRGHLEIRFEKEPEHLRVLIEDDGIGREAAQQLKSRLRRGKGIATGLTNTAERIRQLTVQDSADYSVEILDLKEKDGTGAGTRVELRFPLSPLKVGVSG